MPAVSGGKSGITPALISACCRTRAARRSWRVLSKRRESSVRNASACGVRISLEASVGASVNWMDAVAIKVSALFYLLSRGDFRPGQLDALGLQFRLKLLEQLFVVA